MKRIKKVLIVGLVIFGAMIAISAFLPDLPDDIDTDDENSNDEVNLILECGETAALEEADITIGKPTSSFVVDKDSIDIRQAHAYIRFPITIEAHEDTSFGAKEFGSVVFEEYDSVVSKYENDFKSAFLKEEPDCMPENVDIAEGETYSGVLCIEWDRGTTTYYNPAPEIVNFSSRERDIEWRVKYSEEEKKLNKSEDAEGILPNIPVKADVKVDSVSYLGATVYGDEGRKLVLKCSGGLYLTTYIPKSDIEMWEEYQATGEKLTIEAVVRNITIESGGLEPIISRCILLSDIKIVN